MLNIEFLKSKYEEKEMNHILFVRDELKNRFGDDVILSFSEEIAETVVGLKLDENSVCASLIFPYVLAGKVQIEDFKTESEICD